MPEDKSKDVLVPWFLISGWGIFISLFFILGVPISIMLVLTLGDINKALKDQGIKETEIAAQLTAEAVQAHLKGLINYIDLFSDRPSLIEVIEKNQAEAAPRLLKDFLEHQSEFSRVFITLPDGKGVYDFPHDSAALAKSNTFTDWYRGVSANHTTYISQMEMKSPVDQSSNFFIATSIQNNENKVIGYLIGQYPVETLIKTLSEIRPSFEGKVALSDRRQVIRIQQPGIKQQFVHLKAYPSHRQILEGKQGEFDGIDPFSQEESVIGYYRIDSAGWMIIASQPFSSIFAPLQSMLRPIFVVGLFSFLAMLGIGLLFLSAMRQYHVQRKRTEDDFIEQKEHLAQYQTEVEQLGAFSSLTSHQLIEPVDKIAKLAKEMKEDLAVSMNEKAVSYVDEILAGSKQISHLINQLSHYSFVSKKEHLFEEISMRGVVDQVLEDLGPELLQVDARVEIGDLPNIKADWMEMYQVFKNLIMNAIQFRDPGVPLRIEIRSRKLSKGFTEISVKDNGLGFDEKFLDQLFKPFQKSNMAAGEPGQGLGLAICKKIILHHGGMITAKSKPGEGATIIIIFPTH